MITREDVKRMPQYPQAFGEVAIILEPFDGVVQAVPLEAVRELLIVAWIRGETVGRIGPGDKPS